MIAAAAFLLLPGALAAFLFGRARVFTSRAARVFAGWFVGECIAVFAVYGVAILLVPHTEAVLRKAALLVLGAMSAALLAVLESGIRRRRLRSPRADFRSRIAFTKSFAGRAAFFAGAAIFCVAFYRPHLDQPPGAGLIFRTPIYWDFNVHAPIVQSFAFGDNFPAENESFAGVPETYHFFFDLLTAIPVSLGLDLAPAFRMVSAASLFAVLGLLVGFGEELGGGSAPGMLAALLACTSSSLHAFSLFLSPGGRPASEIFHEVISAHPYLGSFAKGNPFAYNGTMFNLFYFLEERQLVFASGFLLAAVLLLSTRSRWPVAAGFSAGAFFGIFVFWHLFVTITLGLAVAWLLAFAPDRRKTAAVLSGMALVGIGFLLWVRGVARPEWFLPGGRPALRINPGFSTGPGGPSFSLSRAAGYWGYAWGLKALLGLAGLAAAFRSRRPLFHALASVLVPTFLLVNALQIVPLSVYDNHKWLRPMNLFLDLGAAFFLAERVVRGRLPAPVRALVATVAAVAVFLMTVSGVIELIPYMTSRATVLYARYPTEFTETVRARTAPRSVFASFEANALHLAGRKLFIGNDADERGTVSLVASAGFDTGRRQQAILDLYAAPTGEDFCRSAAADRIDWLEVEPALTRPSGADRRAPGFDTTTPAGRAVRFLDVRRFCGNSPRPRR